jgi:hypothetical protein
MPRDGERDALANFVRFVRMNPTIEPDDDALVAVFDAYRKAERARTRAESAERAAGEYSQGAPE